MTFHSVRRRGLFIGRLLCAVAAIFCSVNVFAADESKIDFVVQIKPLLDTHCLSCHDNDDPQSDFKVASLGSMKVGGLRGPAVVPGDPEASWLLKSLVGTDDLPRMPHEQEPLTADEIALITTWIKQGAEGPEGEIAASEYKSDHWAFQPIARPAAPSVTQPNWLRNPIDAFVMARLDEAKIAPAPDADLSTLIRRVSLDLTGLPPSPQELDDFLNDHSPDAYERLVDRLLASPQYGERQARFWLDAARYADSNGFTIDAERSIWKYRDWVIGAFNRDLPFDRFTIEQIAGDMLPDPSIDQLIATGFHRNTLVNQEGGTDPEQFRVDAVVDRVNTTGTVFLGLTLGCAQCHSHKFDPISQREYYQLYDIFNHGKDVNTVEPTVAVPTPKQAAQLESLKTDLAAAEAPLAVHDAEFIKGLPAWEAEMAAAVQQDPAWQPLDVIEAKGEKGALITKQAEFQLHVDFSAPNNDTYIVTADTPVKEITAVRLEALTHPDLPMNGPGRADNGNFVMTEFEVDAAPVATPDQVQPIKLSHAVADHAQEGFPVTAALDGKSDSGWAINVKSGSLNVNREAVFFPETPIVGENGHRLVIRMRHDSSSPKYLIGRFRLSVSNAPAEGLSLPTAAREILKIAADERTDEQKNQLAEIYKATDKEREPLASRVAELMRQIEALNNAIPTTLVMEEIQQRRESYIQIRGDFLRKGAAVTGGVPTLFPQIETEREIPNRLDFAKWLVDGRNPLTARVTVNRYWQQFFGIGLVDTDNDFGTQGSTPTHAKLLDWLADEFQSTGWGIKQMHRLIVTSATYRQSSRVRPELEEIDPANKLLARQNRIRMEAEILRDVSLEASGLLATELGGKGVFPPQPEGIYIVTQVKKAWPESTGADRYRRGLYTFFWRSSPYPMLPTFDAPDGNTACTRRSRSNTPLQALTMANDRTFFEFAQGLAARVLKEGPTYDEGRLQYAYRAVLSREPTADEQTLLLGFLQRQEESFAATPDEAKTVAPTNVPQEVNLVKAAAWTAVSRVLLNLDELMTRE
ncbi:MAG: DUF1553 domain-containing protein [Planctomycetota bacterium]|nr:DUF1553 domain-containing protein [Planctomycetota bacterium]MDA1213165.1 DUF1553 domain-containing protein [Planctomycetota bacterium]